MLGSLNSLFIIYLLGYCLSQKIYQYIYLYLLTQQMDNTDQYAQKFNEQLLQGIYKYFNAILQDPQCLSTQQQILNQKLANERQRVIKMDCLRTRSPAFDQKLKNELQIMLTHYCRINNMIYKQGLNQIAGPFVYFRKIGVPLSKCQAIFHQFFTNFCLNFYDDENFSSIQIFVKMFSVVLKYHDPGLFRYLQWHNVQPQLFCINWLMTFFSSKLSFSLVYLIWSFIAAQKDKFLLFFVVLAIVQINRQKIIQSKNINILQVVTDLIFKDQETLVNVVQRALLLRKNTPSSLILFFRDRMIFQKREKFHDINQLLQHMQNLNLFLILPGQMTLDQHLANGICEKDCYFCDLRKPLPQYRFIFNDKLHKLIQTSSDIRTMNFSNQYVIMDVRKDQSQRIVHKGTVFKVNFKENIQQIQQRFLSQFIQQKGNKHFVFILTNFTFQDLDSCNAEQIQQCKKIIKVLDSLSFPLISILQGGFQAYTSQGLFNKENNIKKYQSTISQDLQLGSFQLPYSFPLKISDRCRLGSALINDEAAVFVGIVQILIIFDYFIFIVPIQKQLVSFINYFEHNHAIIQYLSQKTNVPAQLMVHKVISMRSLKKASMKVHNQNILVLLYDSCAHQQKRIFSKISRYLEMDVNNFIRLGEICKNCQKKKNKMVIQMNNITTVKECVAVLTKKYMQMRKRLKLQVQENEEPKQSRQSKQQRKS